MAAGHGGMVAVWMRRLRPSAGLTVIAAVGWVCSELPFKVLQGALADERLEVQPFMEEVQWRQDIIRVAGKEVGEQGSRRERG